MNRFRQTLIISLLFSLFMVIPAFAQQGGIEQALTEIGVGDPHADITKSAITITGAGIYPEDSPWDAVMYRLAQIINVVAEQAGQDIPVILVVEFQDGEIIQFTGKGSEANGFYEGNLSPHEYEQTLTLTPITRGPLLVLGTCNSDAGDTCASNEACSCYPNESCQPGVDGANIKGCVTDSQPAHSHLHNSQYICDETYVWNGDLTACVEPGTCPAGESLIDGECFDLEANRTDNKVDTIIEPRSTTDDGQGVPYTTNSSNLLLLVCGGLLCLLIPTIIIIVIVLLRRNKKKKQAPAPVATGIPSAPQHTSDPRFSQLEQRFAQLNQAQQNGQLSQRDFQAYVQQLVMQDIRGHWTYSAGQWLWFDGASWVPRDPRA